MTSCLALIRVRLPDRPGALGLVASRIGALKGDIVGIEVLDRSGEVALDELAVVFPDAAVIPAVTREIAEVDGAETESVTIVDAFPEPRLDGVRCAIALTRGTNAADLLGALVDEATLAVRADWCAVIHAEKLVASTATAPLTRAAAEQTADHRSPIGNRAATLLVGSRQGVRQGEQRLITALCELADQLWYRIAPE